MAMPNASTTDIDLDELDEVYVADTSSARTYHLTATCDRLKQDPCPRDPAIAADWYPPCQYCISEGHPGGGSPSDAAEEGDTTDLTAADVAAAMATLHADPDTPEGLGKHGGLRTAQLVAHFDSRYWHIEMLLDQLRDAGRVKQAFAYHPGAGEPISTWRLVEADDA